MDISIVQTAKCNAVQGLRSLQAALPESLSARVTELDMRRVGIEDLPHQRAVLRDATAAEIAQIEVAMAEVLPEGFTLQKGGGFVFVQPDPPQNGVFQFEAPARRTGAEGDLEALWEAILKAEPSEEVFPELSYAGSHAKAYAEVINQLGGIVPMEDQGKRLSLASFATVKRPRRFRVSQAIWDEVVTHLRFEVQAYEIARNWFGDAGHFRVLLRDQVFADMAFVRLLNSSYGLLPETAQVSWSTDLAVAIATKIVGAIHPLVGFVVGQMWVVLKSQTGHSGVMKAAITEMERQQLELQEAAIARCETALSVLLSDWGHLRDFARRFLAGEIDWPDDAAPIRRAYRVGFHKSALKSLVELKSSSETTRGPTGSFTWGLVQYQQSCGDVKRHYDAEKAILRCTASDKECCGGRWNDSWFFGSVYQGTGSWPAGPPPPVVKRAPLSLSQKLFGTGTDADPGLGFSPDFLDTPSKREGWTLKHVRTKYAGKI